MTRPGGVARAADGVDVAWYPVGGGPAADGDEGADGLPPLLLAHATGFHGMAFLPLARVLSAAFDCIAFDERGHGDSAPPPDGSFDWNGFARDAIAVVEGAGLERPFAVGHSAGGAALLLAEIARPGTFRSIYCYEPIVAPVEGAAEVPPRANPLAEAARRRRDTFASVEEAVANYSAKPPMASFHPDALRAYVEHGFTTGAAGGITLKCRPESEARTYEMGMRHGAFSRFGDIRCPVTIAWGSETTTFSSEVFRAQASRLPHGDADEIPGLGHFGPFEAPDVVGASVLAAFSRVARA